MTTAKTRSQLGRMSRNKGAQAERDLVKYLRAAGFGGAERAIRTGYRTTHRAAADPGDVTGTPGIVWSVKDVVHEQLDKWLHELDAMHSEPGDVRLLVHKRRYCADPGRWWCWMRLRFLLGLTGGDTGIGFDRMPIRMELRDVLALLRDAGYGDPAETPAEPA